MRKIGLLAVAGAAFFGIATSAHAANTYAVDTAVVSPANAGSVALPKPTFIRFGYSVGETNNNRPSATTDYVIGFGPGVRTNPGFFTLATSRAAANARLTCSISQAGYVSGAAPNCPRGSRAGSGKIQNLAGVATDPTSKVVCNLSLEIFVGDGRAVPASANDNIPVRNHLVLRVFKAPTDQCALAPNAGIPAQFGTVAGFGTALRFHVRANPFQFPAAGVENSVVNVSTTAPGVGKSVLVRVRRRIRGVFRNVYIRRGLFETRSCPRGGHPVNVRFTDRSGAQNTASRRAPCVR